MCASNSACSSPMASCTCWYDHAEPDEERLMFGLQRRFAGRMAGGGCSRDAVRALFVRGRPLMEYADIAFQVVAVVLLVAVAGVLVALRGSSPGSQARAEELVEEGVRGRRACR